MAMFMIGIMIKIPNQEGLCILSAKAIQTITATTIFTSGIRNKTIHQVGQWGHDPLFITCSCFL